MTNIDEILETMHVAFRVSKFFGPSPADVLAYVVRIMHLGYASCKSVFMEDALKDLESFRSENRLEEYLECLPWMVHYRDVQTRRLAISNIPSRTQESERLWKEFKTLWT